MYISFKPLSTIQKFICNLDHTKISVQSRPYKYGSAISIIQKFRCNLVLSIFSLKPRHLCTSIHDLLHINPPIIEGENGEKLELKCHTFKWKNCFKVWTWVWGEDVSVKYSANQGRKYQKCEFLGVNLIVSLSFVSSVFS